MNFLFILGRTHTIASTELTQVLSAQYPDSTVHFLGEFMAEVTLSDINQAVALQNLLGGVVKVIAIDSVTPTQTHKELLSSIATLLKKLTPEGKNISFGLCEYGRENKPSLDLMQIKRELATQGLSSRFVEGPKEGLSASVLLHQNVDEIAIVDRQDVTHIGHTIAVQNIDEWTLRDREKPYADRRHGMLPPKVARMMLNLAIPEGTVGKRILDPFCGTGTVLLEALTIGATPCGSDVRQDAVDQSRGNLQWLAQRTGQPVALDAVVLCDATKVTPELFGGNVDAIVAEGYLGPQTPTPGKLDNIFKGLEKLYLGAFKQWRKILGSGGRVCIALPRVESGNRVYSLAGLIDSLESLGYNSVLPPQTYDRPDAVVKREIFILELK